VEAHRHRRGNAQLVLGNRGLRQGRDNIAEPGVYQPRCVQPRQTNRFLGDSGKDVLETYERRINMLCHLFNNQRHIHVTHVGGDDPQNYLDKSRQWMEEAEKNAELGGGRKP